MNRLEAAQTLAFIVLLVLLPIFAFSYNTDAVLWMQDFVDANPELDVGANNATTNITSYIRGGEGSIDFLPEDQRSHMQDVRNVFFGAEIAIITAAVFTVIIVLFLNHKVYFRTALRTSGLTVALFSVLIVAMYWFQFRRLFIWFHEVFFPQGNYMFAEGTILIQLFPEPFWKYTTGVLLASWIGLGVLAWKLGAPKYN